MIRAAITVDAIAHQKAEEVIDQAQTGPEVLGLLKSANDLQEAILKATDTTGLSERELSALRYLAMARALTTLGQFCEEAAAWNVRDAREVGATWQLVALATGYSAPSSAAQRFDPVQRDKVREANRKAHARRVEERQRDQA